MTAASVVTTMSTNAASAVVKASNPAQPKTRVFGCDVLSIDVVLGNVVSYLKLQDIPSTIRVNKQWKNRVTVRVRLDAICVQINQLERSLFGTSQSQYDIDREVRDNCELRGDISTELHRIENSISSSSLATFGNLPVIGSWLSPLPAAKKKLQKEYDDFSAKGTSLFKLRELLTRKGEFQGKCLLLNLVGGAKAAENIATIPAGTRGKLSSMTSPIMKMVNGTGDLVGLLITAKKAGKFVGAQFFCYSSGDLQCSSIDGLKYTDSSLWAQAYLVVKGKVVYPKLYETLRRFLQHGNALFDRSESPGWISETPEVTFLKQITPERLQHEIQLRNPASKKYKMREAVIRELRNRGHDDLYEKLLWKYLLI